MNSLFLYLIKAFFVFAFFRNDPLGKIIDAFEHSVTKFDISRLSEMKYDKNSGKYYITIGDIKYFLTLDRKLQQGVSSYIKKRNPYFAVFIAISPKTGKILAYVEHSNSKSIKHPSITSKFPSASIFKLITVMSLIKYKNFTGNETVCIHGGKSIINKSHLIDNPRYDRRCMPLKLGLAKSNNSVIGKLAFKNLKPEFVEEVAHDFGFESHLLPFPFPYEESKLFLKKNMVDFAIGCAGFWASGLSPAHGVLIATLIANRGKIIEPYIVDSIYKKGIQLYSKDEKEMPKIIGNVLKPNFFEKLIKMMIITQKKGTGVKYVGWDKTLSKIKVACKSGTLSGFTGDPLHYSWFLGFAPADNPKIAFISFVGKKHAWGFKSGHIMRRALKIFFSKKGRTQVSKF